MLWPVDNANAHRCRLDQALQELALEIVFLQQPLSLPHRLDAARDVTDQPAKNGALPGPLTRDGGGVNREGRMEGRSIACFELRLPMDGLAGTDRAVSPGHEGVLIFGGNEKDEGLVHQGALFEPQEQAGRTVCLEDKALEIGDQVSIGGELEEVQVAVTLDTQLFLGNQQLFVLSAELLLDNLQLFDVLPKLLLRHSQLLVKLHQALGLFTGFAAHVTVAAGEFDGSVELLYAREIEDIAVRVAGQGTLKQIVAGTFYDVNHGNGVAMQDLLRNLYTIQVSRLGQLDQHQVRPGFPYLLERSYARRDKATNTVACVL